MAKLKYFSLFLLVGIIVSLSLGSYCVRSSWIYGEALSSNIDLDIDLIVMPWEGADDLPNQSETGNNHKALVEHILSGKYDSGGTTQNIGLNEENSYLANEIAERKSISWRDANQLGSMDIWQSDKISEYFNLTEDSNSVAFILVFPDNEVDTYYLYTTSVELGDGWSLSIPEGTSIYPVYRTTLQRNSDGVWEAVATEIGSAKSAKYTNPLTGLKLGNAFDTNSWTAGKLGTSTGNAVYTKSGLNLPVYLTDASEEIYYYYDSTGTSNVSVKVADSENAIAYVYDSNGKLVTATSGTKQGSQTVTFKPSRNARYYIKFTGDTYCTFTIG